MGNHARKAEGEMNMKEKLVKIGDKYWPLEKIMGYGTHSGPEGDPPKTRDGQVKWQQGPKVRHWIEHLQFRGFRLCLTVAEKDCPELAESVRDGSQFIPGPVEEITPPDRARFMFAGSVKVRLTVEKYSAEGAPPLSPEEIKAAGEIIDALEMRDGATKFRIWTTLERGGEYVGEYRELEKLTRNAHGDFVFTLDGGERWQFTPHNPIAPTVETVKQLGIGRDSKTGKPSIQAFLILTGGEKCVGNLRILPKTLSSAPDLESKIEGVAQMLGEVKRQGADHSRLLHRVNRRVDGVPPLVNKLKERNSPALAEMAAKLTQKIRLGAEQWDTFYALIMEGKTQTQVAIERGMGKKDAYKISREWAEIKRKFLEAGEPVPEKITRHNAVLGEDGVVFKKTTKRHKRRG